MKSFARGLALVYLAFACLSALPQGAAADFFNSRSIARLAPVVILHGDESLLPTSAEDFLDHADLAFGYDNDCDPDLRHRRADAWTAADIAALGSGGFAAALRSSEGSGCVPLTGAENEFTTHDLTRPRQGGRDSRLRNRDGWYLDLADDDDSRTGLPDQVPGDDRLQTAAPTYYDDGLLYSNGEPNGSAFVTYWFFYAYNDGFSKQNHEGDWENVSIRLEARGAGRWAPVEVFYARHGRSKDVLDWDRAPKIDGGGRSRLEVFSARGSHAAYPDAGPFPLYDDRDKHGLAWATGRRLSFLWDQSWAGYCGAWGRVGRIPDTTGPLGPGCFDADDRPAKTGRPGDWGESLRTTGAVAGADSIVFGA